jgi:hypothetical protein
MLSVMKQECVINAHREDRGESGAKLFRFEVIGSLSLCVSFGP